MASLSTLIFDKFFLKKKKKNGRLFGIVVKFEKKKKICWKEMIKAKERNVTTGIKISKSLLEKKMTVGEPKKM